MWDIRGGFSIGIARADRNQHLKVRKGACQHGNNRDDISDHHKPVCVGGSLYYPGKECNEEIDAADESDDAGCHDNPGNCPDFAFVLRYNISQSAYPRKRNGDADTMA